MEQLYQQEMLLPPSLGDAEGRLAYHRAFSLFMDIASAHSERLGTGVNAMLERDLFWLTVRSRARFLRRPRIGEKVVLRTWPELPGKARVLRSYQIMQGDEVLVAAKTEWAVLNVRTRAISPLTGLFPQDMTFELPSACPERFVELTGRFQPQDKCGSYRVLSTDIDLGGHMNNAAYLRAMLGRFDTAQLAALDISQIDLVFRAPCFESDELELYSRAGEAGLDLAFFREGKPAFLARLA